jgi:hypothetical protein
MMEIKILMTMMRKMKSTKKLVIAYMKTKTPIKNPIMPAPIPILILMPTPHIDIANMPLR